MKLLPLALRNLDRHCDFVDVLFAHRRLHGEVTPSSKVDLNFGHNGRLAFVRSYGCEAALRIIIENIYKGIY